MKSKNIFYSSCVDEEEDQSDEETKLQESLVIPHALHRQAGQGGDILNHVPLLQKTGSEGNPENSEMSVIQLKRCIVDMCSRIFRVLGPGFRENAYEKALEAELNQARFPYLCQAPVPIHYLGQPVAMGYADIIVNRQVVLELKAAKTSISPGHLNQCRGYMRALHIDHGLLINFPQYKARTGDIDVFDLFLGKVPFRTVALLRLELFA